MGKLPRKSSPVTGLVEHPEYGEVVQLQGDQRERICQLLVKCGLVKHDQLKVHGFLSLHPAISSRSNTRALLIFFRGFFLKHRNFYKVSKFYPSISEYSEINFQQK